MGAYASSSLSEQADEDGQGRRMRVFLDSNIVRHAATRYYTQDIYFGGAKAGEPLIRRGPIQLHTKRESSHPQLRAEIQKLRELAIRLKTIDATVLMDDEAFAEVKKAGSFRTRYFHGTEIKRSKPPLRYSRVIGLPGYLNFGPTNNHFHNFLSELSHPRFLQIAKAVGALQGVRKNYNQLADAFFLWCAETNDADYFLTLDGKLRKYLDKSKRLDFKPTVVSPSELIEVLVKGLWIPGRNQGGFPPA